jgi:hypothetical protein
MLCAVQALELDEHYDNTDDMYCDIADRLEAVEAAAPAASLAGHLGSLTIKKDGKLKSGGGKVGTHATRQPSSHRESGFGLFVCWVELVQLCMRARVVDGSSMG